MTLIDRRRRMMADAATHAAKLVLFDNGEFCKGDGLTSISTPGGFAVPDVFASGYLYLGSQCFSSGNKYAVGAFSSAAPVLIPPGYTKLCTELVTKTQATAGRFTANIALYTSEPTTYNDNALLWGITGRITPNYQTFPQTEVDLSTGNEYGCSYGSAISSLSALKASPHITVYHSGAIPTGSFYFGAYVHQYGSANFGASNAGYAYIKRIWLE